jgi:flagellar basal-body rod protein FlgF
MEDPLVSVASALHVYERKLDAAALNLSHLRTPGYLPRTVGARSFSSALGDAQGPGHLEPVDGLSFARGEIVASNNPLAVALTEDGFFEFRTPDGPAYGRGGDFEVVGGVLSSRGGFPVEGIDGPIAVEGPGVVSIAKNGAVTRGGATLGKLKVVDFADQNALVAVSDTFVRPKDGATPTTVDAPVLAPGMVELPGTQAVQGLVEMISIQRSYESAQRASSLFHQAYEQLLRSPN